MGGDHVSGHFYLERKYGLSYHKISPRWLQFDLLFDECILLNQRGFFNFIPLVFGINRGIGVLEKEPFAPYRNASKAIPYPVGYGRKFYLVDD